jgi:hypothetical protein
MRRVVWSLLVGVSVLGMSTEAWGARVSITLEPAAQSIGIGGDVQVDVVVHGLGNHSSPSLGAFDLTFGYNASIVGAISVTFGPWLDLGGAGSIQGYDLSVPGVSFLYEVSAESSSDLNAQQPDSFTLSTIGFHGLAAGLTSIGLDSGSLSDEEANSLAFDFTGASITVLGGGTGVPDCGTTLMLLCGAVSCLGLVGRRLKS